MKRGFPLLTFFARTAISPPMSKLVVALLSVTFFLAGCAESPQSTGTQSSATASVAAVRTQPAASKRSVWVEPPTGSHIGGGFARNSGNTGSNDEPGLASAIKSINAAESSPREQSYALAAVSVVSGVSQAELVRQQNQTQLRLGELFAFNTIARNREAKVHELVGLRSQGKSWTDIAQANGTNIAAVAKIVRRGDDLTVQFYLKSTQGGTDTADQLHDFGRQQGARQPAPPAP
jgi:hypothetical protein